MKLTAEKNGSEVLLKIEGRVDTTNYGEFENSVNNAITDEIKTILMDCSEMNYISSSGLRVFLVIQKKMMASGGKFKLFGMQSSIKEIFDISGFSKIFEIYPDKASIGK